VLTGFVEGPAKIRNAIRVIVVATTFTTILGGVLVWLFDRRDFPTLGDALWWALQTVTTVGYGDITPKNAVGRAIGAVVLLYAVAFLTILTATITTTFVEQARRERGRPAEPDLAAIVERLDAIDARLARIEATVEQRAP
jgi:voltage-gated potassium channel